MKKTRTLLAVLCLLFTINLNAQDSIRTRINRQEKERWHLFNNIACFNIHSLILNGGSTSLLYKRRYDKGQFVKVSQTKARRFLLDMSLNKPLKSLDTFDLNTNRFGNIKLAVFKSSNMFFNLGYGMEWENNMGRFQFYFGRDFHLSLSDVINQGYGNSVLLNNNTYATAYYGYHDQSIGVGATGFAGITFFIHPRISISAEGGVNIGATYTRSKISLEKEKSFLHSFNISGLSMARRMMTLNFHF